MADRVPPVVDLLLACRAVKLDEATGTYILTDPHGSTVRMPDGVTEEFVQQEFIVFVQVLDAVGEFQFRVEVRDEFDLRVTRSRTVREEFGVSERLYAKQLVFRLPEVEFAKPGAFQIVLLAGEKEIGEPRLLRVLPGK